MSRLGSGESMPTTFHTVAPRTLQAGRQARVFFISRGAFFFPPGAGVRFISWGAFLYPGGTFLFPRALQAGRQAGRQVSFSYPGAHFVFFFPWGVFFSRAVLFLIPGATFFFPGTYLFFSPDALFFSPPVVSRRCPAASSRFAMRLASQAIAQSRGVKPA